MNWEGKGERGGGGEKGPEEWEEIGRVKGERIKKKEERGGKNLKGGGKKRVFFLLHLKVAENIFPYLIHSDNKIILSVRRLAWENDFAHYTVPCPLNFSWFKVMTHGNKKGGIVNYHVERAEKLNML